MFGDIWGYPYRLGIGIFFVVGTFLLTVVVVAFTTCLERSFKRERLKK